MVEKAAIDTMRIGTTDRGAAATSPADKLPTLQRNALRRIFGRSEFTPEDVARLNSGVEAGWPFGLAPLLSIVEFSTISASSTTDTRCHVIAEHSIVFPFGNPNG
jgi:hypothetical protein